MGYICHREKFSVHGPTPTTPRQQRNGQREKNRVSLKNIGTRGGAGVCIKARKKEKGYEVGTDRRTQGLRLQLGRLIGG